MTILRLWLLVFLMTAISWAILKLIRQPMNLGLNFLFWIVAVFGSAAALYAVSVWLAV